MTEKSDTIVAFFLIFSLAVVFILICYITLFLGPTIINNELANLPLNSNGVYPIFLQGLLIVAGLILGLFGILFIETTKKLSDFIKESKLGLSIKTLIYSVVAIIGFSIILITIFSIFSSINAMIYYGIIKTYITTQIDANVIHTISTNGTVILINASYINHSITSNTIATNNMRLLLNNSKHSITFLFIGFTLIIIFILIYLIAESEATYAIKKFADKGFANTLVITFIVFFILFLTLHIIENNNLYFVLAIIFLILMVPIFAFKKKLNQSFENSFDKIKRKIEKKKNNCEKPNPPPPPPSSPE